MAECEYQIDFEKRLTEIDQRLKSNTKKIEEMKQSQLELTRLTLSVERIANRQQSVQTAVREIKTDVKSLKEKPARYWQNLIQKLIWLIAGSAVAALFLQGGIHLG